MSISAKSPDAEHPLLPPACASEEVEAYGVRGKLEGVKGAAGVQGVQALSQWATVDAVSLHRYSHPEAEIGNAMTP